MTKQPNRWSINCSRNQYMLKLITLELERGSQVKLLGQILRYLHRRHSKHSEQQTSASRKYAGNINVIIGAYERDVDQLQWLSGIHKGKFRMEEPFNNLI